MTGTNKSIEDSSRADWSERALIFYEHWQGLRKGNDIPTSENFLDSPNTRVQSNTFIFELEAEDKTVFRLVGTELVMIWGRDFTGLSVEQAFSHTIALRYLTHPKTCPSHPCGLWERGLFGDARGREVTLELMYLPLLTQQNRAPRIGGFLNWHGTSDTEASRLGLIQLTERHWIDIGSGCPQYPPDVFSV